jgi:ribokinase
MAMLPADQRDRFTDYTTHGPEHRFAVWTRFAPDGSEIPSNWLDRVSGVHCAAMPVERHLSIGAALRSSAARDAWIQVDSPWYDERDLTIDFATKLFALIDALLPSEDDVRKVAGPEDPLVTVSRMLAAGARTVVLKRGDAGADIFRSGSPGRYRQPAYPCSVSDLTGAGDAFCGGFLAGMHRTGDVREAAAYGTVSASFAVQAPGVAGLMSASRTEAQRRLADLKSFFKSYAAS